MPSSITTLSPVCRGIAPAAAGIALLVAGAAYLPESRALPGTAQARDAALNAPDEGEALVLKIARRLERLPGRRLAAMSTEAAADTGTQSDTMPTDGLTAEPAPTPRPMVVLPSAGFGGKLLLTGGVSQIEGAAGGGLVPWAVIGGYGTSGQWGANVFATRLRTGDFGLDSYGLAVGINDRVELSVARQSFDTRAAGAALGLGAGFKFEQNIVGAKVRLLGDAVLDSDQWMPQVSAGVQAKQNLQGSVVRAVGARSDAGTDVYLSATKLLLGQGVLLNGTVRWTRANQLGLLGFGGDLSDSYSPQGEFSAAYLLSRQLAVGGEYRTKPNNLSFAREQSAWDGFLAWAPTKNVSVTLAYVALGDVATLRKQRGWYVSAQAGF